MRARCCFVSGEAKEPITFELRLFTRHRNEKLDLSSSCVRFGCAMIHLRSLNFQSLFFLLRFSTFRGRRDSPHFTFHITYDNIEADHKNGHRMIINHFTQSIGFGSNEIMFPTLNHKVFRLVVRLWVVSSIKESLNHKHFSRANNFFFIVVTLNIWWWCLHINGKVNSHQLRLHGGSRGNQSQS